MTSTVAKVTTMPIYTVLKGEHNEVSTLMSALEATPNIETGRSGLLKKLHNELKSHTVAEQQAVYGKIKTHPNSQDMVKEAEHEHQGIDKVLNELESTDITSDAWLLKLSELKQAVHHHVKEEETEMFDRMHKIFSEDEARDMTKEFVKLKTDELNKLRNQ